MVAVPEPPKEVGAGIPAHTPHAVSVMLPTWQDNIGYEEGDPRLSSRLSTKFGKPSESCMLFPSRKVAERCREFMQRYYKPASEHSGGLIRIADFEIAPPSDHANELQRVSVYIVLFPEDAFSVAKQFWQHSGDIFSSRMAEYCLRILDEAPKTTADTMDIKPKHGGRYSRLSSAAAKKPVEEEGDHSTYLEERYGRNLPVAFADRAKRALRCRIAGVITEAGNEGTVQEQRQRQGDRGITGLSEDEVYIYPCGMSAIFHAHQCAMAIGDASRKSVCFGFPYTDTLKILQKWGAGCHFYGIGEDKDIDKLEQLLESGERILSLFCELPSNPLLKSPDIRRLRQLADKYGFIIAVDETIGNFCNVNVLERVDIVVSSLTKVFSGDSNVMGGSLVLNPRSQYHDALQQRLDVEYEDLVWGEDAIFLERNSRTFKARSQTINENAEALCDYLVTHPKVKSVFYPKFVCREHYDAVKTSDGGFGGLFSMMLASEKHAEQFYDNLDSAKGPSLGTNFTLACPYTILAHYTELDWVEQFGVSRHLVRVSVGLEDREKLLNMFSKALDAVDA
ncbi:hypothetical protein DFQ28_000319 [Apophysomyces sp. BC1034]|nr:hypothetical protein DFQ28_000319 [Apophysomyces sp. BC1034]